MSQVMVLILAFTAGLAVGLFYYGGLWLTIQRLPKSRHPGILTSVSLFLRLIVALAAFYLIMGGRWERLLVCLTGFLLMRTLLVHRLGPEVHYRNLSR